MQVTIDASGVGKPGKKVRVPVTPATSLSKVREEACQQLQLGNPVSYQLRSTVSRQVLDVSLPFRLSNLANNAKLELIPVKNNAFEKADSEVMVAVQCTQHPTDPSLSGKRWTIQVSCHTNLHMILQKIELENSVDLKLSTDKVSKQVPVLYYVNQRLINWKTTTLAAWGVLNGSVLLKLCWETTAQEQVVKSDKTESVMPSPTNTNNSNEVPAYPECTNNNNEVSASLLNAVASSSSILPKIEVEEETQSYWTKNQVRIYRPTNRNLNPEAIDLTDSFYEFTVDDLEQWKAERAKRQAMENLMTKEKRQSLFPSNYQKERILVRVKLPDGVFLEASFSVKETLESVYSFLSKVLRERPHFYLLTSPPPRRWIQKDLSLSNFVPGVSFYLGGIDYHSENAETLLLPFAYERIESSPHEQVIEREEQRAKEIREQLVAEGRHKANDS
eukprot:jgi/Galph1/3398/GphlegSOOS_G2024.1